MRRDHRPHYSLDRFAGNRGPFRVLIWLGIVIVILGVVAFGKRPAPGLYADLETWDDVSPED